MNSAHGGSHLRHTAPCYRVPGSQSDGSHRANSHDPRSALAEVAVIARRRGDTDCGVGLGWFITLQWTAVTAVHTTLSLVYLVTMNGTTALLGRSVAFSGPNRVYDAAALLVVWCPFPPHLAEHDSPPTCSNAHRRRTAENPLSVPTIIPGATRSLHCPPSTGIDSSIRNHSEEGHSSSRQPCFFFFPSLSLMARDLTFLPLGTVTCHPGGFQQARMSVDNSSTCFSWRP